MGWRFRKSKKLGPLRLNFSKRGVGVSTGFKGFRIGQSPDGRRYMSIGIPGTGISYMHYFKKKKQPPSPPIPLPNPQTPAPSPRLPYPAPIPFPTTPPSNTATARLVLKRDGIPTGDIFHLGERALIGRNDSVTGAVDVDLSSLPEADYISRHHAQIWRDPSANWFIQDLGSRNGTFVRAAPVTQSQGLNDGDEIVFGGVSFEFHIG